METISFQDAMGGNHCWGCGKDNPKGLQIKSYWEGEEAVCTFHPRPEHMAGPTHILNGGIIATVLDCHTVCTAMAALYRAEGREIGEGPVIWCATARLDVTYLRPTPIDRPVHLRARVEEIAGRKVRLSCTLYSGGLECARAEVLAVRVPEEWRTGQGQ
ncbi:PaaI family thioesterase [Calidithermus timidus]|jgi:acyl-coenzyme A thioesterase PaaI-like protein|uniref:PaaI family thioesterase n=1 Tax=Calidithermus timidus TaxID=307124 RepID=UPI00037204A4|nr:PaaI family thioesterase [Calidithermus timidus]